MARVEQPIDVSRSTLGGALRNGPLSVPNHQREYSWKKDRVAKLFDDFGNAMVKRQASYFLGTIVMTPGKPPNVIDGQQRLATTTIFLAAARDALIELGQEQDAKSIDDDFLFKYDRGNKEDVPRLRMNTDDRAYMHARVLARPAERKPIAPRAHSHRRINDAAELAAERVRKIIDSADTTPRKVEALNQWIEFIDETAVIVQLTPPNPLRAYQMFKTLNDRAQRTTQADMIKNHLFEHAGDSVDEAQSKWSSTRTTIEGLDGSSERDPLLVYLHHLSVAFYGPIHEDDIFEKMEQSISGRAPALAFLDGLASHANDYAAIITPSHTKWGPYDQRVRQYVEHISQDLKMVFIRPLMLAIAGRFPITETHAAYRMCVAWVVRFLIVGGHRSGAVEKVIGDTAHAIFKGEITTAIELLEAMRKVVPDDVRFKNAFATKTIANGRQARFVLYELESQARGSGPGELLAAVKDTTKLSLEHVLPKDIEVKRHWDQFTYEEKRAYRNRLGNMVLLATKDNGAVGNKAFEQKRAALAAAKNFETTHKVIELTPQGETWTKERIDARQEWLADLAVARWPLS